MNLKLILAILVLMFTFIQIYGLGWLSSNYNEFFENNAFAKWAIGLVTYLILSFVVIFPLMILDVEIIYYAIIWLTKDFIVLIYIFMMRLKFKFTKFELKQLFFLICSGFIILLIYNFGMKSIVNPLDGEPLGKFDIWDKYKELTFYYSEINIDDLVNWFFTLFSILGVISVIGSLIFELSKTKGIIDFTFIFLLTIFSFAFINIGYPPELQFSIWFIPFAILFGVRMISFSRRRYAVYFGLIIVVSFATNPQTFGAMLLLGFTTTIVYTGLGKPKASMFWAQIISPLIFVGSLWLVESFELITIILSILSLVLYVYVIRFININWIDKLNTLAYKMRIAIPAIYLLTLLVLSIYVIATSGINIEKLSFWQSAVFDGGIEHTTLRLFQLTLYTVMLIFLAVKSFVIIKNKENLIKVNLLIIVVTILALIMYNPVLETVFHFAGVELYFGVSRIAFTVPVIIIAYLYTKDFAIEKLRRRI